MTVIDKHGVLNRIHGASLELGCGSRKRYKDFVGIDLLDDQCVDIVGDALEVLKCIPDGSIANVSSFHFFEHVEDVPALVSEIARILQPGGSLEIVVPHFSNPFYYSDLTHKSFYGLYTFSYFSRKSPFRRTVPTYGRALSFDIERADLLFKSPRPFYFRYALRRMMQALVNLNMYTREFYEENLSGLVSCYEIRFVMRRVRDDER